MPRHFRRSRPVGRLVGLISLAFASVLVAGGMWRAACDGLPHPPGRDRSRARQPLGSPRRQQCRETRGKLRRRPDPCPCPAAQQRQTRSRGAMAEISGMKAIVDWEAKAKGMDYQAGTEAPRRRCAGVLPSRVRRRLDRVHGGTESGGFAGRVARGLPGHPVAWRP